ncbi:hypothetical protein [Streptomyces sp. NPDC018000]|uniref:hypothetical protein n=1 Tax=Streptomyces sp. NPDC018000 TaxID=3365028 RepID=UPI0037B308EB
MATQAHAVRTGILRAVGVTPLLNARAVLDQARRRIAADYAAGRLSPEHTARYEQLITNATQRRSHPLPPAPQ